MEITLTLVLEKHELHWIDKIKKAYKLAGSQNPDYELAFNPFQEIFNNHFLIDDVLPQKAFYRKFVQNNPPNMAALIPNLGGRLSRDVKELKTLQRILGFLLKTNM